MAAPTAVPAPSAPTAPRRSKGSRYDAIAFRACKPAESFADWKGVWVIVEHRDGKLRDVTLELLGAARPMADKLGHKVTAVLLGHKCAELPPRLLAAGADEVILAEHPMLATPLARPSTDVINKLIEERKPNIVLIGATHTGRDISSRVAATLDAGMTADCTELDVDAVNGELLARRPAFGGKMLATIRCDRHRPQMATARPGIFKPLEADPSHKGPVHRADVKWLDQRTYAAQVVDYVVESGFDITKEQVLVAGGLGVGGPEGFQKLQELADALGGQVACSRPVADKGWVERSRQVGQTGVSVRPKLYVAVGISGAIQHIEGMKESGTIIAINSDPNAAIFSYADIGLVGDWKAHVDALIAEARKRNLKGAKWMVPVKDTLDADRQAAAERAAKAGAKAAAPAAAPKPVAAVVAKSTVPVQEPPAPTPLTDAAGKPVPPLASTVKEPTAPAAGNKAPPTPATQPAAVAIAPEQVSGKFLGNPKDAAAVKAFAAKLPETKKAWVLAADCIVCNGCQAACPTDAAIVTDMARVDRDLCIADGACFDACPTGAIRPGLEEPAKSGGWPKGSRLAGKFGVPEA
ncbi:MAG: electron transfer flavoprotein alpha subunit [Thermoplasmata archaeon]|jgi:electron transfer flavoprotein alpha subunit|nr:electron transfer flavoprotein alpha subunit [Thermoplasmata archaeon]